MVQREVILIFGKTGEGKSSFAKQIIAEYERVIVFDTLREYDGLVFYDFDDFAEYFKTAPGSFFVVCRFPNPEDYQYAAEIVWIVRDVLLVMEEADNYLQSVSFNDPSDPMTRLVTQGRHRKVSILAITQRAHLISITLRSMFTRSISFWQTEPRDLAHLTAWGFDPDEVRNLEQFQHVELQTRRRSNDVSEAHPENNGEGE